MTTVLETLLGISEQLARAGVPALSPYWGGDCTRVYQHPTARLLVEMVGRGGDKSRTSTLMAIAEVLAGEFNIPPGERHYFTHVSENRDEAAKTLGVLEQYLRLLHIPADRSSDTIELRDMPRGFKVLAARVGAVSGWRCIGWTADEQAKWSNEGVDPSEDVVNSIAAMTVTHPNARGRLFSSPLGRSGFFFEQWEAGNRDDVLVGHAASWVANPSVTLEHTIKLARGNMRVHKREYEAIPQEGVASLFSAEDIDRAMRARPDVTVDDQQEPALIIDASRGGDAWTFATARWRTESVELNESNSGTAPSGRAWEWAVASQSRRVFDGVGRVLRVETIRQDVAGAWHLFEPPPNVRPRRVLMVDLVDEIPELEMRAGTDRAVRYLARVVDRRYEAASARSSATNTNSGR